MEKDEIKVIISEVFDEKLKPITYDLDCIKTKLNNHIEHFAYQFTEVKQDVAWLKKLFDPKENTERDAKSLAEIGWLKWGMRLMIGGVVGEAIAITAHIFLK